MKLKIYNSKGEEKSSIEIPEAFTKTQRPDILLKVFEAQKGFYRQPYGSMPGAGAQYSASGILKHRRHVWKSTYGRGISRIPRKIISNVGEQFRWIGATVASTRGGRRAHPPKAEKNLIKKINKKELKIAFLSALAGTFDKEAVRKKYSIETTGIVFDSSILKTKTKEFLQALKNIFKDSLEKALQKKQKRAGKGKLRGRKYKKSRGLLFVIASDEEMKRKGIDVVKVSQLSIKDLAPNGEPGRITAYTEKAIKELEQKIK